MGLDTILMVQLLYRLMAQSVKGDAICVGMKLGGKIMVYFWEIVTHGKTNL